MCIPHHSRLCSLLHYLPLNHHVNPARFPPVNLPLSRLFFLLRSLHHFRPRNHQDNLQVNRVGSQLLPHPLSRLDSRLDSLLLSRLAFQRLNQVNSLLENRPNHRLRNPLQCHRKDSPRNLLVSLLVNRLDYHQVSRRDNRQCNQAHNRLVYPLVSPPQRHLQIHLVSPVRNHQCARLVSQLLNLR